MPTNPLGRTSEYTFTYDPTLLYPIGRKEKREEIGIGQQIPFKGVDIWNAYELSWLNPQGKPIVAIGEFYIPCESPRIIESKSFKLYLNSLTNTRFQSLEEVKAVLKKDLEAACGASISLTLSWPDKVEASAKLPGYLLDHLDITLEGYVPNPDYLTTGKEYVEETVTSNLLKSNCLITHQPDWGSLQISYKGNQIDHEGLLTYIVSYRDHHEFHEQCVERIFTDIITRCQPKELTVYARYTRRGGLDINPYRTNGTIIMPSNPRMIRQ